MNLARSFKANAIKISLAVAPSSTPRFIEVCQERLLHPELFQQFCPKTVETVKEAGKSLLTRLKPCVNETAGRPHRLTLS
jgi:hypothetical protein